jgi:hypothetical protein
LCLFAAPFQEWHGFISARIHAIVQEGARPRTSIKAATSEKKPCTSLSAPSLSRLYRNRAASLAVLPRGRFSGVDMPQAVSQSGPPMSFYRLGLTAIVGMYGFAVVFLKQSSCVSEDTGREGGGGGSFDRIRARASFLLIGLHGCDKAYG